MRGVMLLSLAILLLTVFIHGCETPQSPLERIAADRAFLEKEIRAYAEKLVAEANAEAAKLDGQVRVETCEKRWVVFFEPIPKPEPKPEPPAAGGDNRIPQYQAQVVVKEKRKINLEPPAAAVRREWTDRYALAQTFEYRWSLAEIGLIQLKLDEKVPCEAEVTFQIRATRTTATATDIQPLPNVPDGTRLWRPSVASFFGVGRGGGSGGESGLPCLTLPGRSVEEVADEPLAQQALRQLASADDEELTFSLKCPVTYDAPARTWNLRWALVPADLPSPARVLRSVRDRQDEGALPAEQYAKNQAGSEETR